MPWFAYSGLYLVIWSALLIDCLFRREFYPVFGRRWGTKAVWLLTFVFLNPLLTLIYFVFGFLLSFLSAWAGKKDLNKNRVGRKTCPSYVSLGSAVAIILIGVVLVLFELPLSLSKRSEPVVLRSGNEDEAHSNQHNAKFQAHIGTINAGNKIQTLSTASADIGARISMRNILIICQSPHELLEKAMREFQKSLVRLPYVSEVVYYPFGTRPKPGALLPDVFIIVNMPHVNEKYFIRSRYLKTNISWTAGSSIFAGTSHSDRAEMLPSVRFDIESQLEHESRTFGIESSQAKYKLAADGICSEMIKSISKQFENLLDKYDRMPESPEILNGLYHKPPEFSFLKTDKLQQLISGSGLLKNNHTVWRFADDRQIEKALTAYRDELKSLGWGQDDLGKENLRMRKGNEYIYIFHRRRHDSKPGTILWSEPEKTASEAIFIADYESDLTDDQMQKAIDALLDSGAEMETLLIFEKYFRTPEQLERLRTIIEGNPVKTLDGCLMLARYWADHGETDKSRESLLRARVMQRTEKYHNVRADEIKSLAGKLGDESLAEAPVAEEVFRRMGFIDSGQINEPVEIKKSINEPVLIYHRLGDGQLHTFALRVIRSRESSNSAPYRLLSVKSRKGSLNSSENSGKVKPGGIWVADISINASTSESKPMRLQVKSLEDEHFLFTITP